MFQINDNPLSDRHVLPELFKEIVTVDNDISSLKKESIISFFAFKTMKETRVSYSLAAEKFIQRQRGGT